LKFIIKTAEPVGTGTTVFFCTRNERWIFSHLRFGYLRL